MDRAIGRHAAWWITGAAVAVYLVARAVLVPLTYDEAATIQRYVDAGVSAVFDFNVATNHLLNTCLTWLSVQIFGSAPWAVRLPTVFGGIAFIVFAGAVARRAATQIVGLASFVLIIANPYLLDYLALSRGYGLALGLLTASVYYLLEWLDTRRDSPEARRPLVSCVWLAATAVLATFTVLPAFLALVAIVTARLVWTSSDRPGAAEPGMTGGRGWRFVAVWLIVAAGFSLMVFSRQKVLSADLFTPITVRTVGLFEAENDQIQVFRLDATGRPRLLVRDGLFEWHSDPAHDAWGMRIELPISVDRNLTSLEVAIGRRVFRRDRHGDGPWTARDSGSRRVLLSTTGLSAPRSDIPTVAGAINWGGDAGQWRLAARYTVILLACLTIGAILLASAAAIAVRAGRLAIHEARLIVSAIVGVAGLTAAPLYLLRRDAQLYFGGTTGLVSDTFGSLVEKSAYGLVYVSGQVSVALAALAVVVVALVVSWAALRTCRARLIGPLALLSLLGLIAAIVTAQHVVLGTPWLTGRTALFLVPLIAIFVVVTAEALAGVGPRARSLVTPLLVLLAIGAGWHTTRAANLTRTLDWPDDAATPAMLAEVAARVDRTTPRTVRVGVQWMFYPVARYYADRMSDETITYAIEVAPAEGPAPDYVYTAERLDPATATLVGGFTGSPAALWQSVPAAGAR